MFKANVLSNSMSRLGIGAAAIFTLAGCGAADGSAASSEGDLQSSSADLRGLRGSHRHCAPPGPPMEPAVPAALSVPATATLVARYHGVGTQIYTCAPNPNATPDGGVADVWTFKAPSATLYTEHCCVAGTHSAGPTWLSTDGSSVVGSKVASAASPNADSIPILLLKAVSNNGTGIFTDVTFVQRLDTQGGVAPAGACDNEGAELAVPYEANYYFYKGGI